MVVAAPLSAERLRAPSVRGPRVPVALSFVLHGAVVLFLVASGAIGSAPADEPAFMVEIALAAPAPTADTSDMSVGPAAEPPQLETSELRIEVQLPTPPESPPPVETREVLTAETPQPPPPEPETVNVELPPPDDPPPVKATELRPPEPPTPKAAPPKPTAQVPAESPKKAPPKPATTQTASPPDQGTAQTTQVAAASPAPPSAGQMIVWEDKPRYRSPPTPPVYPARSIELNQQGEARVRVRLHPDGSAAEILLHRSTGFELLDRAALAAVRGWRFLPAMRDGRSVAAWVEIPVRFHLR
jgi:protein TonB